MRTLIIAGQGGSVRNYGAAFFSIYFSFLFFFCFVASKGCWLVAEVVLSFVIFWFNLLIWIQSFGVRVEARSTLRKYMK